jgi:streptogramin lyase
MRKLLAITAIATLALGAVIGPASAWSPTITEYTPPTAGSYPTDISLGPNADMYFTDWNNNTVDRITTAGVITEYPLTTPGSAPIGITVGSDASLYVAENGANKIAKMSPFGVVTEYPIPTPGSDVYSTASGPGGVWFTERNADKIGRLNWAGTITEYPLPASYHSPLYITQGPDDAMWFSGASLIGRIGSGGTIAIYPVVGCPSPGELADGPDGRTWFACPSVNKVGAITTSGVPTLYDVTPGSGPFGITAGRDGNIWFTERYANALGRISTSGYSYTEFPLPAPFSDPRGILTGPDGALWFTETAGRIGTTYPQSIYPTITLKAKTKGAKLKVKGTVFPKAYPDQVQVDLYVKHGAWNLVSSATPMLSNVHGKLASVYSTSFTRPRAAKCKVTASFLGDPVLLPVDISKTLAC